MQHDAAQPHGMPAPAGAADLLQPALALGSPARATNPRTVAGSSSSALMAVIVEPSRADKTDTSVRKHADTRDSDRSSRNPRGPGENVALMTPHHQAFQALPSMITKGHRFESD
jgi:hypothetical protein